MEARVGLPPEKKIPGVVLLYYNALLPFFERCISQFGHAGSKASSVYPIGCGRERRCSN